MLPHILNKDKFEKFVGFLMSQRRVVAPVAKGPQFAFEDIASAEDVGRIRMDYDITILPPKKYLHPQVLSLLEFDGRNPAVSRVTDQVRPMVILGAHPYDLHGIATLDAAFAMDPNDPQYLARRKAACLIGVNVQGYVDEHQFMADMGTTEPPAGGFDLFLTDLGERYYVESGSSDGEGLIARSRVFATARPDDFKAKKQYDEKKAAALTKRLPYDTRYLPELLGAAYDWLQWEALSRRCFSCGTCTNVCPTCYCFDVQDKLNIDAAGGVRRRTWDSCQLRTFAEVAGGENFREHRSLRLRHRVFRKGAFILERTGRTGCVGCGRCTRHCVAKISILEAFQQIADQAAIEA
jgi:sulfhydrogenase subunit beta (sulfur reductase)